MRLKFFGITGAGSINKKIFSAALTVGLMGMVARTGVAVKELVVAQSFGRTDVLDAFLIALLLPTFVMNLLMSALGAALVPVLVEMRQKENKEGAQRFLSSILTLTAASLIVIAALLGIFARWYLSYVGSSFSGAKLLLTGHLLYAMLPFVVFGGIAAFLSAVLNANEKFALAAIVPLLTPLLTILLMLVSARRWGTWSLAAGTVAGSFLEAAVLFAALRTSGVHLAIRWNGWDAQVRSVMVQFAPMLVGAFLMGSTSVVDQSMAAMLSTGSVAALNYANKITGAVLMLGATALSTAALPYFAMMVAEQDWQGCRHTLKRYSALIAAVTVPCTLLLMALARPLVRLLFQRGAFSAVDTEVVSRVLICYSLQIPFFVGSMLLVRFLSAMRRNDLLMYASAVNLVLDVVLNLVLMRKWGIAGIALSTSLVFLASFLFVAICSLRLLAQERFSAVAQVEGQEA